MRATEALHLADPGTELNSETLESLSHCSYKREHDAIIEARKLNRQSIKQESRTA